MEDAATAEISRAQLWQWVHNEVFVDFLTLPAYDRIVAAG